MKKSLGTKLSCFIIISAVSVISTYAQTCENSGIGITAPTSKLHIKGCGNTSATSALHVMNSGNAPLLFIRDNGYVGVGTSNPLSSLDVVGWQYLRDSSFPMLMMNSTNVNATKDLGIHFDGNGPTPSHELRLGRYAKSTGAWEANVVRVSMMAPENSFYLGNNGALGLGLPAITGPMGRLDVNGWQYLRDAALPMLMMSSNNVSATKDLGIHYDGNGASPSYEFRLGRYNKSTLLWEANILRFSMLAPDNSLSLDNLGCLGVGLGVASPIYKFQVRGKPLSIPDGQYGQMVAFQDNLGVAETFFVTKAVGDQVYNPLVKTNDNGIFWKDDAVAESANGFVIAPWSASLRGIRIDGPTGNVGFGVSAPLALIHFKDGHIRSEQTTLPTVATITTGNGITAAALATGSTDTKGTINLTGDNNGTANSIITINFNKTYTVAPVIVVSASNAQGQAYTLFASAGTSSFTINLKDAGTNTNPSFNYIIIE